MDIGNLKNNYTFYEGYEDEDEIVLYIETDEAIHIWEGYFDDILILRLYKEKVFDFDETKDVFNLIVSLLKKAIKRGVNVKAERILLLL